MTERLSMYARQLLVKLDLVVQTMSSKTWSLYVLPPTI